MFADHVQRHKDFYIILGCFLFFRLVIREDCTGRDDRGFPNLLPVSERMIRAKSYKLLFVMFYSPDCRFSAAAMPEFLAAAEHFHDQGSKAVVLFGAVNCLKNRQLCRKERIGSFPTFRLYRKGDFEHEFLKQRREKTFVNFLDCKVRQFYGAKKESRKRPWGARRMGRS